MSCGPNLGNWNVCIDETNNSIIEVGRENKKELIEKHKDSKIVKWKYMKDTYGISYKTLEALRRYLFDGIGISIPIKLVTKYNKEFETVLSNIYNLQQKIYDDNSKLITERWNKEKNLKKNI